jgi:hypothetical protein
MKNIVLLFFLIFSTFYSFGQSEIYAGDYTRKPELTDGNNLKWTLTLNTDGTFLYNFYRNIEGAGNPEENFYGKGTWKAKKNLIFFYTDKETDFDETYTIDFTNSKAKYITKSPRDTSKKVVKTALRFYEYINSLIKGLELFKE